MLFHPKTHSSTRDKISRNFAQKNFKHSRVCWLFAQHNFSISLLCSLSLLGLLLLLWRTCEILEVACQNECNEFRAVEQCNGSYSYSYRVKETDAAAEVFSSRSWKFLNWISGQVKTEREKGKINKSVLERNEKILVF